MLPKLLVLLCTALPLVLSQSNYASQGNSIEYQPGLPPSTVLDGKVTKLDDISSMIFLNRTKAYLNCSQGSMHVELKFEEPFYGVAYADFDRNSACIFKGRGATSAKLELPLKGCGTRQDPQRVFTNNVVVRFHPGLEMDGDEVITIVCRYPPPMAPAPPAPPASILATATPAPLPEPPLKGFQILLIICAILFLSLLLLGLGCSYMCLKRRNVRVIHRHPFGSGSGSEITKLSTSSLSNITMFEGLKIPRAHALLQPPPSTTGSDANLMIDHSLPSDYPSESSEVDEEPSLPVSSAGSYDNKAFVHHESHQRQEMRTTSSLYSETVAAEVETSSMTAANASRTAIPRHMVAVPIEPKFDVQMRVKRAPPPPPSPLPSESDVASVALERNLTTILEKEESSLTRCLESPPTRMTTFSYVPELHGPPGGASSTSTISRQQTPPVYSRILRKQAERETTTTTTTTATTTSTSLVQERIPSPSPVEQAPLQHHEIRRPRSLTSLNTELTETRSLTEVTDHTHAKYRVASILAPTPPPPPPIVPTATATHTAVQHREHRLFREEVTEPLVEPQVVAPRRPEITTHEVDDVFLKTVTEKKTIEDVERHRRQVTEYRARPQPPPDPKWDVTIRNYPQENLPPPPPEWENFSDVSSTSNLTITNEPTGHEADPPIDEEPDINIEPTYTARAEIPCRPPPSTRRSIDETDADWFTRLSRVLDPRYTNELTEVERTRWREIITTDSTLRTLLTEAVVKEDYELIRKDARYTNLFPPAKWDVIIRILGPPSAQAGSTSSSNHGKNHGQRYKRSKSSEWDTRSRRSSLPTLYEYESDGGSSARTQGHRLQISQSATGMGQPSRLRRLGSSHRGAVGSSEVDVRSMSEMTVRDFARVDRDDLTSLSSFEGADSLVRSLSQPSLARSGSEFTEHWGIPSGMMDLPPWAAEDAEEGTSSVETTPRVVRRNDRLEVLTSFDDRIQVPGSSTTKSSRYMERELSSVRVSESQRTSNWFHDDSEPEMQI
ncbi:zona pellucida domain protein papillote [Ptiloglossa arizonensis]|uniref:zona pellucida domain protein papillote n=1 Tax=Ptiloglossa arizonensis TaxID=3350558 RepID=UPI003FA0E3C4